MGITVPKVYKEMCTRRILVSEWMDGVKLSECPPEEIAKVTAVAQEAFLTQLFGLGFFHGEPLFECEIFFVVVSNSYSSPLVISSSVVYQ